MHIWQLSCLQWSPSFPIGKFRVYKFISANWKYFNEKILTLWYALNAGVDTNRGRVHPHYALLSVAHQSLVINDYYQLSSEDKERDISRDRLESILRIELENYYNSLIVCGFNEASTQIVRAIIFQMKGRSFLISEKFLGINYSRNQIHTHNIGIFQLHIRDPFTSVTHIKAEKKKGFSNSSRKGDVTLVGRTRQIWFRAFLFPSRTGKVGFFPRLRSFSDP